MPYLSGFLETVKFSEPHYTFQGIEITARSLAAHSPIFAYAPHTPAL
ncbi:MAG TPA: hypothetical protein V6D18_04170 [Thermosynechococcaceae cyanobacterium]